MFAREDVISLNFICHLIHLKEDTPKRELGKKSVQADRCPLPEAKKKKLVQATEIWLPLKDRTEVLWACDSKCIC